MRTAAAKGKSWRLIAAGIAALVAAGAAEASRFTPASANSFLEKQGVSSIVAAQHVADLAPAFASEPAARFPLLTAADREALTAPLAGALAAALEDIGGEKLASGGQTWEIRPNLWRLHELTTISHPSRFAYARNRWYDPRNASWLSEDPLQDVDSPNLYAFVAWQPHMATDRMGTQCFGLGGGPCSGIADAIELNIEETARRQGDKTVVPQLAEKAIASPVTQTLRIGESEGRIVDSILVCSQRPGSPECMQAISDPRGMADVVQTAGDVLVVGAFAKGAFHGLRSLLGRAPAREVPVLALSERTPQRLTPYAKGELAKDWAREAALARGETIVGEEVDLTFTINGKKVGVRADLLTQPEGADYFVYVESKYSPQASYTQNQSLVIPELVKAGDEGLLAQVGARSGYQLAPGRSIRVVFQGDVWNRMPVAVGQ